MKKTRILERIFLFTVIIAWSSLLFGCGGRNLPSDEEEINRIKKAVAEFMAGVQVDPAEFPWYHPGMRNLINLHIMDQYVMAGILTKEEAVALRTQSKLVLIREKPNPEPVGNGGAMMKAAELRQKSNPWPPIP